MDRGPPGVGVGVETPRSGGIKGTPPGVGDPTPGPTAWPRRPGWLVIPQALCWWVWRISEVSSNLKDFMVLFGSRWGWAGVGVGDLGGLLQP